MPSAWASRAGPEHSRRGVGRCRAAPPCSSPATRFESPQQDAGADALRLADQVDAEVHAVGEVDVEVARAVRTSRRCARPAAIARGSGVVLAVGLGLDDAPAGAAEKERAADQVARDVEGGAREEGLLERAGGHAPV